MRAWPAFLALCCCAVLAAPERVIYMRAQAEPDIRDRYFADLLQLALDKTRASHGAATAEASPVLMRQSRALLSLEQGRYLDVLWTMTSREREAKLAPIRIPLLRGLLGYRLLVIRRDRVRDFAGIGELASLAALTAVQGHDWPDTAILRANGLRVETSSTEIAGMYAMLRLGRVDYFPRGVNEAWTELARLTGTELMVEPHLLLRYTAPVYFFVRPGRPELAARIETGLRRALADGSLERHFRTHPATRSALTTLEAGDWTVLELENPTLPDQTPVSDTALWYRLPDEAHN